MKQIAPGVYIEDGYPGVTVGCIIGKSSVICIDSPMLPADARHWREQIAQLSDRPVQFVVLTDANRDRILGLQYLGGTVVAHEAAWEKMKSYGDTFRQQVTDVLTPRYPAGAADIAGDLHVALPQITFTQVLSIYKDDAPIRIRHMGGATPQSSWVYLPQQSVLFMGDLATCHAHPVTAEADISAWLDLLERVQQKDFPVKILVPGRGGPCTKAALEPLADYLRTLRTRVQALIRSRRPKSEMAQLVPEFLGYYPLPEGDSDCIQRRIKAGLDHLYDALKSKK